MEILTSFFFVVTYKCSLRICVQNWCFSLFLHQKTIHDHFVLVFVGTVSRNFSRGSASSYKEIALCEIRHEHMSFHTSKRIKTVHF